MVYDLSSIWIVELDPTAVVTSKNYWALKHRDSLPSASENMGVAHTADGTINL